MLKARDAVNLFFVMGWLSIANAGSIYSCVDDKGRRLTSDRPIPECLAREQRVLNGDGSVRGVVGPALSAEEEAEAEARERKLALERAKRQDAVRRDRLLLSRYPDNAAYQKARTEALAQVMTGIAASEKRVEDLKRERMVLLGQAAQYKDKPMPTELRQKLNTNEATAQAQLSVIQNQKDEASRINAKFDTELERLRQLWSGTAPGTP